jgi:hypothetical protein
MIFDQTDLLAFSSKAPAIEPTSAGPDQPAAVEPRLDEAGRQWLTLVCGFCEFRGGQYLEHYGKVKCRCGRVYWALQPKRPGPLKLFPHPEQPL